MIRSERDTASICPSNRDSRSTLTRVLKIDIIIDPRANIVAKSMAIAESARKPVFRVMNPTNIAKTMAVGRAPNHGATPITNAATMPGNTECASASPMKP